MKNTAESYSICISCDAARLREHPFQEGLKMFRPPQRQHEALLRLLEEEKGLVSAAFAEGWTVAYAAFQLPDPFECWSKDPSGKIWELGAVEVSPQWRGRGLAVQLLKGSFETGFFEDKVVVAQLLSWHYDTKGTGLSPFAYRDMLIKLYGKFGFREWRTEEADIAGYVENALVARMGSRASEVTIECFHKLRRSGRAPWDFKF